MLGAPLDFAYTLPDDWRERVLAHEPTGADASLVRYLQEAVRSKGEISIALRWVQDLALWLTEPRRQDRKSFWPNISEALDRLSAAAGGAWPGNVPVSEKFSSVAKQHIFDISSDVYSMSLEWFVLDELVRRGARPVPAARSDRSYDWMVDCGEPLGVEVKQKGVLGRTGHQIEWFWKGTSLLAKASFLSEYQWRWHVADDCRSDNARRMIDAMWAALPELRDALAVAVDPGRPSWIPHDRELAAGRLRLRDAYFTQSRSVAIELLPPGGVLVDARTNDHPSMLVNRGSNAVYRHQRLDSAQADLLARRFASLNLAKQATRRKGQGLFVIAWWVPLAWEGVLTAEWLDAFCERVAHENGLRYLAIWPIALFESRDLPWSMTGRTAEDLPWLAGSKGPETSAD